MFNCYNLHFSWGDEKQYKLIVPDLRTQNQTKHVTGFNKCNHQKVAAVFRKFTESVCSPPPPFLFISSSLFSFWVEGKNKIMVTCKSTLKCTFNFPITSERVKLALFYIQALGPDKSDRSSQARKISCNLKYVNVKQNWNQLAGASTGK